MTLKQRFALNLVKLGFIKVLPKPKIDTETSADKHRVPKKSLKAQAREQALKNYFLPPPQPRKPASVAVETDAAPVQENSNKPAWLTLGTMSLEEIAQNMP